MTPMIGRGDAKMLLQNCAEKISANDQVLILVKTADGGFTQWGTEIPFEVLTAFNFILADLTAQVYNQAPR